MAEPTRELLDTSVVIDHDIVDCRCSLPGLTGVVDEQDVTGHRGRTVDCAEEEDLAWR